MGAKLARSLFVFNLQSDTSFRRTWDKTEYLQKAAQRRKEEDAEAGAAKGALWLCFCWCCLLTRTHAHTHTHTHTRFFGSKSQKYKFQLEQVEASLSLDPHNDELAKLADSLREVCVFCRTLLLFSSDGFLKRKKNNKIKITDCRYNRDDCAGSGGNARHVVVVFVGGGVEFGCGSVRTGRAEQ